MAPLWAWLLPPLLLLVQPTDSLRAAVFEYTQQSYKNASYTPEDIVRVNLEYYAKAALFAASKGVDILVFPEYGLFPPTQNRDQLRRWYLESLPEPGDANPCLQENHASGRILRTLSCLARQAGLTIVANMGEVRRCEGDQEPYCPEDGAFHYNANVAIGEDGRLVAKYRKEHLFGEAGMDVPPPGQDPTFDTPLGRFATFVCFDLVFGRAAEVARMPDIRAVLLPTMWMNSGPLFNAHQYFASWAAGNQVTLLAANVHLPGHAGLGSVIVGREGVTPLQYTFDPDRRPKLLIADVDPPTECSTTGLSASYVLTEGGFEEWNEDGSGVGDVCSLSVLPPVRDLYSDYRCMERGDLTRFALRKLESWPSGHLEACQGGVCCALEYSVHNLEPGEAFYLGVFNGTYNAIGQYFFAEENCFVARCEARAGAPCATFPMRTRTRFRRFRLRARFSTDFVYPSVVESGMRLARRWTFEKGEEEGVATILLDDDSEGKALLVAGMKARPYARDPPYVK